MSAELKPCPFCGADAAIRNWQDEELWSHAIVEWQKVHCTECECEGISSCPGYEPDTVQAWNARAPQWQPIETAPRDGMFILLTDGDDMFVAYFNVGYGTWDDGDHHDDIQGLTHWQRLPAPPEVK